MKSIARFLMVAGIAAVAVGTGLPQVASADEFVSRYSYFVNGVQVPASQMVTTTQTLTQPAVIQTTPTTVLMQPAVIENTTPAVVAPATMIQDHENMVPHLFHLGLWPLVDFSLF